MSLKSKNRHFKAPDEDFLGGNDCKMKSYVVFGVFFLLQVSFFFFLKGIILAACGKIKPGVAVQGEVICPTHRLGGPLALCVCAHTSLERLDCVRWRIKLGHKVYLQLRRAYLQQHREFFRGSCCHVVWELI